jgi:hypothetical protein
LCCLFFFDIRILITPLLSSNSSLSSSHILSSTKGSNKCPQFRNFVHKLMTLYSCLLPLSEKNNLIPYSIFDHLTCLFAHYVYMSGFYLYIIFPWFLIFRIYFLLKYIGKSK